MDKKVLIDKAYVEISRYRYEILLACGMSHKTPSQLSRDSNIRTNHVSNVLRDLKEHGLMECINEEARKGRLYCLTEQGTKVYNEIIYGGVE